MIDLTKDFITERVSDIMNETKAYQHLGSFFFNSAQVKTEIDMHEFACELEQFIVDFIESREE